MKGIINFVNGRYTWAIFGYLSLMIYYFFTQQSNPCIPLYAQTTLAIILYALVIIIVIIATLLFTYKLVISIAKTPKINLKAIIINALLLIILFVITNIAVAFWGTSLCGIQFPSL